METGGRTDYTEFLKDESGNDTITISINDMDKQILGFLAQGVKEGKIKKYDFNVPDKYLDYFTFIKSDQIDIIATYGDLIYIDGTYKTNKGKFIVINITVVDKHMKSYVEAVGYMVHENYDRYAKMLKFIKTNIPFKKTPYVSYMQQGSFYSQGCKGSVPIHQAHILRIPPNEGR